MDGTAANNSIDVPNGLRNHAGQVSVKNTATPKANGTASTMAMAALAIVPTMAMAPPKSWLMTSHSIRQINWSPNFWKVGQALMNREIMIPSKATSTKREKPWVTLWKKKSCNRCFFAIITMSWLTSCPPSMEVLGIFITISSLTEKIRRHT